MTATNLQPLINNHLPNHPSNPTKHTYSPTYPTKQPLILHLEPGSSLTLWRSAASPGLRQQRVGPELTNLWRNFASHYLENSSGLFFTKPFSKASGWYQDMMKKSEKDINRLILYNYIFIVCRQLCEKGKSSPALHLPLLAPAHQHNNIPFQHDSSIQKKSTKKTHLEALQHFFPNLSQTQRSHAAA